MPKRCSVAGCRSNYDGENEYTTVFSIPKKEPLRSQWLKSIPTDFKGLKNPVVCVKHFEKSSVIWEEEILINGELKKYPREVPKYKEDAVPTIFPNLPKYLSSTATKSRRLIDAEKENFNRAVMESIAEFKRSKEKNTIHNFDDIINFMKTHGNTLKEWVILKKQSAIALCHMSTDKECPAVSGCITIAENLEFNVYINNIKIDTSQLPSKEKCLKSISVLESIITFVENRELPESSVLDTAINTLKLLPYYDESQPLQFLIEQLILLSKQKNSRIYSNQTMIFASCLYIHSSSAYNILHKTKVLCLPHPKNLQKLVSKFSLDSASLEGSISYLNTRKQFLKPHELLVNLHIDEIYIQQELSFKGGSLYGNSECNPSKLAKTAQVFMISSVLSKYKDVVSIIPVNNLTSEQLKEMCVTVIHQIEKLGFSVIAIVSDNNNINRRAFELFSTTKILQPCVPHPISPNRKLFFIFDTVHIIKCIRNNWLSKKDGDKIFKFPHFETGEEIFTAHYKHLEQMYEIEKNLLVKYGHLLSFKALYPSSIQKQNVDLALRIFSDKNIVALQHITKDHPSIFSNIDGTCLFLDIIVKFWKICNVKSVMEGKRFNDKYREAIKQDSVLPLQFLRTMSLWLKRWRQCVPISQALTSQTFQATINTIDAFLLLVPYLFENYTIDYVILSKFQNDAIESRFGIYRQMSGSNYYISFLQLLESERRIRFKNNVLLSSENSSIPIKTLLSSNEVYDDTVQIQIFQEILNLNFCLELVPDNSLSIIIYIGGYTVQKLLYKQKCDVCRKWLQLDKEVTVEGSYDFLKDMDKGKLILPTESVVMTVAIVWFVMTKIMRNYRDIFMVRGKQLSVLYKLSCIFLKRIHFSDDVCSCNEDLYAKLENICLISCKIFISNFVQSINDSISNNVANKRKIQKLI